MTIEQPSSISKKEAQTFARSALVSCCGHSTRAEQGDIEGRCVPVERSTLADAILVTKHPTLNTSAVARSSAGCTMTTTILNNFCTIVSSALLPPFDLGAWPRLRSVEVSSLTRYTSLFSYSQHPNTCYGLSNGLSGPLCNLVAPQVSGIPQTILLADALVSCHR